jgi:hypothetical protein
MKTAKEALQAVGQELEARQNKEQAAKTEKIYEDVDDKYLSGYIDGLNYAQSVIEDYKIKNRIF